MSIGRVLSAILYIYCVAWAAAHIESRYVFAISLSLIFPMLGIWIPGVVNDYTLGLWVDGYRIDTGTPEWMIRAGGWLGLLGYFALIRWPHAVNQILLSLLN